MAFNQAGNTNNTSPINAARDDNWKAQGFINLYLPAKSGGRKKLGAIPLKEGKPHEKTLLDWLNADPNRAASLLQVLEIEYQSAEPSPTAGFDLPADPVAPAAPSVPAAA